MCMGVPRCPLRGPPAVFGFWGALHCPPCSTLPSASSACCPHCPPGLGIPGTPRTPGWLPLPCGTLSGHGGAVLSPSLLPALRGVAAGLGQLVALQSPPRLPLSVGVLWGSPWLHSHSPLELLGEFRGDPRTVATSCSPPGPPSRGSVPLPFTLPGSPALGGPHPVGFPVPRGSPALGGRWARAGPSNADFVSLSPV